MSDNRSYSEGNFDNRRGKQLREESEAFFSSNCYMFFGVYNEKNHAKLSLVDFISREL